MKSEERIDRVRSFNRFYTKQIGVLQEGLLSTEFSLIEARIIYELSQQPELTASGIVAGLNIDAGYLSRILNNLEKRGIINKSRSEKDGRRFHLQLTDQGHKAFDLLNERSRKEVKSMLQNLSDQSQNRLVNAMHAIEGLFSGHHQKVNYVLRSHQPGDIGWITHRHGVLYFDEYGWDERFEALVAGILADFVNNYNPEKERSWIAEVDGEVAGSVLIVQEDKEVARLRLLLVEPKARGFGIGKRLVEECIRFSRRVGYKKITLWTNSVLTAARHIYKKAGFNRVKQEKHQSFGHDLIGESWELELQELSQNQLS